MKRRQGHDFPHPLTGPWGWFWRGWRALMYTPRPDTISHIATHETWAELHSNWRMWNSLLCMWGPPGHIYKNIFWPWLAVMVVAVVVEVLALLNVLLNIHTIPLGTDTLLKAFSFTSFIVSLLLSQRLGRAYDRWSRAWAAWAGLGRALVDLAQEAAAATRDTAVQEELERWGAVLLHSTLRVLQDAPPGLHPAEAAALSPGEAAVVLAAGGGAPRLALGRLREVAAAAELKVDGPLGRARDALADSLVLLEQAPPQALNLMASGFLFLWLLLLRFGLWEVDSSFWLTLPAMVLIAAFMLGCDEVATQLEYPWPLLPLDALAAAAAAELRAWRRSAAALAALSADRKAGAAGDSKQRLHSDGVAGEAASAGSEASHEHAGARSDAGGLRSAGLM